MANEINKAASADGAASESEQALQRALHDLRVHQIELETQNAELRRTLAELDKSQARYFDFYDLAPVGYCTLDEHGLIERANLTTAKLLEVPRKGLIGQCFSHFVEHGQQEAYYLMLSRVLNSGEIETCEFRLVKSDGASTWLYLQAITASNENGAQQIRLVLSDISQQREQSEQLRLQALVLDQIQDTVTVTDLNGIVTYLNRTARDEDAQAAEQMLGRHVSAYGDNPQADATQQEIITTTLTQGAWSGRVIITQADGTALSIALRTALIRDAAGTPVAMVGVGTDITRQLELERGLHQREAYLRAMLDNFPFKVWLKDREGRYLAVNQVLATLHGWPSVESLVGKTVADITDPESTALALAHEQAILASGRSELSEHQFTNQGQPVWVETYKAPILVDGHIVGTVGYSRDISERRQQEEKLRLQALVLDQIQDQVTITDLDGIVTYLNHAARASGELPRNTEARGQHVSTYGNSPQADAQHDEIIRSTLAQGGWEGKVGHRRADGSETFYALRTTLVRNESKQPVAMVGVGTDITRQLELERGLHQREAYLRAILDNFPFEVWLKDLGGHYLAVNQMAAIQHGWPSGQSMVGKQFSDIVDPSLVAPASEQEQQVIATGSARQIQFLMPIKGEPRWHESYIAPLVVDGHLVGTVGYSRDISERKQIELDLQEARDEAVKANRAKSHFLAAASHDLRQPIFALSLFFGSLKKRIDPQHGEMANKIDSCIETLSELLTDLLDVSKLEAGIIVPKPCDFSLADMLGKLIPTHEAHARSAGLRLRWRQCELIGRSDPVLLGRIVGNFLDNAVRHTRAGGLLITCRRHAGRHWIEVWDTGVGIAEEKTSAIFEAFTRLDAAARTQGSGLGLAIASKTAALLGLQIRLRSRPGRGSMFAIELPMGQEALPEPSRKPLAPMRALRIALVDDDSRVLQALALTLESAGHELVPASGGQALLAALGQRAPDVLVSDYRLAENETGFDVIESSRQRFGQKLPALLITGDTDPSLIRSMAARGITVLYKPLEPDALLKSIQDAIQGAASDAP